VGEGAAARTVSAALLVVLRAVCVVHHYEAFGTVRLAGDCVRHSDCLDVAAPDPQAMGSAGGAGAGDPDRGLEEAGGVAAVRGDFPADESRVAAARGVQGGDPRHGAATLGASR